MCGLIAIRRLDGKDARKTALNRYENQKHRGQEGYGFVALRGNEIVAWNRATTEAEIRRKLNGMPCTEIIFHHRQPTSTANVEESAHPIKVSHASLKYDWYVSHNGMIWEDEKWREKHLKLGFEYQTEILIESKTKRGQVLFQEARWNDSETLAIELALDLEGERKGVLMEGIIAFIALQVDKKTGHAVKLYWGTDGTPLKYYLMPGVMEAISSEGQGDECKDNTLYERDYMDNRITETNYQIGKPYERQVGFRRDDPTDSTRDYPADPQEAYYGLIERAEELKQEIDTAVSTGGQDDILAMEDELEDIEEAIENYERQLIQ